MSGAQTQPGVDLGTNAEVESPVLQAGLWVGPTLTVLPLLAWIALEIFQLLGRAPLLQPSSDRVATAFEVVATARKFERVLAETERAQLGYRLTARPGYLDLYREGASEAPALVTRLRSLTADDVQQTSRMSKLEDQLALELSELNRAPEAGEQEGIGAARRFIQNETDGDAMRTIGEVIGSVVASENARVLQHLARLADADRNAVSTALALGALAVALTMAGIFFTALACRSLRRADRVRRAVELQQRRALEEARSAMVQSQKMEALGRVAGGVGHDFNNLLLVIRADIELLQTYLEGGDSRVRRYIDMAKRATDRASGVMQRLLGFSRQQPAAPRPINLNEVVLEMAELLRHALTRGVSIRTILGDDVGTTVVDSGGLETSILNLAVNARDAMEHSGELTMETTSTVLDEAYTAGHREVTPGRYAMLAMRDTGIGMSSEVIARACDPFFTTKGAGEGTGLGLSQVRDFVRQARGHIAIESEPGLGTTVRLYLPYPAQAVAHPASGTSQIYGV
jgi:signal transduction histidine kinase